MGSNQSLVSKSRRGRMFFNLVPTHELGANSTRIFAKFSFELIFFYKIAPKLGAKQWVCQYMFSRTWTLSIFVQISNIFCWGLVKIVTSWRVSKTGLGLIAVAHTSAGMAKTADFFLRTSTLTARHFEAHWPTYFIFEHLKIRFSLVSKRVEISRGLQHYKSEFCPLEVTSFSWGLCSNCL